MDVQLLLAAGCKVYAVQPLPTMERAVPCCSWAQVETEGKIEVVDIIGRFRSGPAFCLNSAPAPDGGRQNNFRSYLSTSTSSLRLLHVRDSCIMGLLYYCWVHNRTVQGHPGTTCRQENWDPRSRESPVEDPPSELPFSLDRRR
jgi:hypothetical protein